MRIDQLVTDIARLNRQLCRLGDGDAVPEDAYLTMRKRGEELLSEAQVRARRRREFERKAAVVRAQAAEIGNTLAEHYLELSKLHSIVTDAESEARLSCKRAENHTRQRIDAYWRSVLRTHPEQERMPAFPLVLPGANAERAYFERYAVANSAAKDLLERFQKTADRTTMEVE